MSLRVAGLAIAFVVGLAACGGSVTPSPLPNASSDPRASAGSAAPGGSGRPASPSAGSAGPSLPGTGGTWTAGAPTPSRRAENAAVALDGVIYLAGGMVEHGDTVDLFEAFDTRTGTWSTLPPLPERRDHMGLAVLDGKIYLTGGSIFYQTAIPSTRPSTWRR